MTLPHDHTRCATPCALASRCRRTDPGRPGYQSHAAFPGGEGCDGFIERETRE